jgi:hypothetical protein
MRDAEAAVRPGRLNHGQVEKLASSLSEITEGFLYEVLGEGWREEWSKESINATSHAPPMTGTVVNRAKAGHPVAEEVLPNVPEEPLPKYFVKVNFDQRRWHSKTRDKDVMVADEIAATNKLRRRLNCYQGEPPLIALAIAGAYIGWDGGKYVKVSSITRFSADASVDQEAPTAAPQIMLYPFVDGQDFNHAIRGMLQVGSQYEEMPPLPGIIGARPMQLIRGRPLSQLGEMYRAVGIALAQLHNMGIHPDRNEITETSHNDANHANFMIQGGEGEYRATIIYYATLGTNSYRVDLSVILSGAASHIYALAGRDIECAVYIAALYQFLAGYRDARMGLPFRVDTKMIIDKCKRRTIGVYLYQTLIRPLDVTPIDPRAQPGRYIFDVQNMEECKELMLEKKDTRVAHWTGVCMVATYTRAMLQMEQERRGPGADVVTEMLPSLIQVALVMGLGQNFGSMLALAGGGCYRQKAIDACLWLDELMLWPSGRHEEGEDGEREGAIPALLR